jgi:hypothetical protein
MRKGKTSGLKYRVTSCDSAQLQHKRCSFGHDAHKRLSTDQILETGGAAGRRRTRLLSP